MDPNGSRNASATIQQQKIKHQNKVMTEQPKAALQKPKPQQK